MSYPGLFGFIPRLACGPAASVHNFPSVRVAEGPLQGACRVQVAFLEASRTLSLRLRQQFSTNQCYRLYCGKRLLCPGRRCRKSPPGVALTKVWKMSCKASPIQAPPRRTSLGSGYACWRRCRMLRLGIFCPVPQAWCSCSSLPARSSKVVGLLQSRLLDDLDVFHLDSFNRSNLSFP